MYASRAGVVTEALAHAHTSANAPVANVFTHAASTHPKQEAHDDESTW